MHTIKSISIFATLLCLALVILSLNIITFFPESSTSSSSELFTEPQTNNSTLHAIDSKSQAANSLPEPTKPLPILPLSFNSSSINVESLSLLSPPYTFLQSINTSKNLIFIGDVHGALPELKSLLTTIKYNPANDHLIFLGDLVAKGPSSLEVLEYVRKLSENGNIDCVRGNHDDKLLRWKFFLEALSTTGIHLNDYVNKYELPKHLRLENEHMRLASVMDKESYEFLLSCPMVIEFPDENLYAVHAGLLPNILPNEQDPMDIMNMRNIKPDGHPTKSKKQGKPWSKFWNFFQSSSSTPKYIVYGHDASRGLTIKEYSFGLDSKCVEGGKLTALMWNEGRTVKSVNCQNYLS